MSVSTEHHPAGFVRGDCLLQDLSKESFLGYAGYFSIVTDVWV